MCLRFFGVFLMISSQCAWSQTKEEFLDLEKRIVRGFKQLDGFELTATGKCSIDGLPDDHYSIHFWCKGAKIRSDKTDISGRRFVRCLTGKDYVMWEEDSIPGEVGIAIHRFPYPSEEKELGHEPANPRLFGMSMGHIQMLTTHESNWEEVVVGTKDRNAFSVRAEDGGVLVGEWTNIADTRVKLVLGQKPLPHVLRIEASSSIGTASLNCTPGFSHPEFEIGYPRRIVLHQQYSDGVVLMHEEVDFEIKPSKIAEETFTLVGLNIPTKNIYKVGEPDAHPTYWD